jgi:uncharacterized SAM-binding protein YcdF (DUF218 family)
MFYFLAQTFWFLCAPSHLAVWLLLAAVVLLYMGRVRAARNCAVISFAVFVVAGFSPVGLWLMHPVENQYRRSTQPTHIDGILILGGGNDGRVFATRGTPSPGNGLTRLVAGYELARQHPEARLVFAGGPYKPSDPKSEARAAREILVGLGLPRDRIILEPTSHNTWENFTNSRAIVKPKDGETWVLVTSAFHMPRAMKIASKVNWPMIPWPADYTTATNSHYGPLQFTDNLERTDQAVHEGIGILVYRLSGKAH